ncbi:MAG TPA: flagellar hook-associated protein 3, partial [Spirochaetia bacterium]
MKRISSQLPTYDSSYWMRLREFDMNQMTNRVGAQSRIKDLRDDPMAAARSTRFQSEIMRTDRYGKNIESVRATLSSAETSLRSGMDILQRIRELAVQGANGTLDPSQMGYIGEEVDQLLGELITLANGKDQNGNSLFAGSNAKTTPFRVTQGRVPGGRGDLVVGVDYLGNIDAGAAEISEGSKVPVGIPGNVAFWAENQQIYSTVDAGQYRVQAASTIRIDGAEIHLAPGDTVSAVAAKINDANAPVRASVDSVTNGFVLQTTIPHQVWAEDLGGGTVLQDLGIIARGSSHPPLNVASSARTFGGSLFDMVINLRDALFEGSAEKVGGSGLRGIDNALTNLAGVLGDIGARDNRLETVAKRLDYYKPELVRFDSQERD